MKILIAHNAYQQRGGEDTAVAAETHLLAASGHTVIEYRRHNDELKNHSMLRALTAGVGTIWSSPSHHALRELLAREKPDVAHFHNTFPLISPSAYYACANAGVPVVQTLHNYRLICPAAIFLRDGHLCEACLGHNVPWPGVVHRCYRESMGATAAITSMLAAHRLLGTWNRKVGCYVALSEFARKKFIEGGLPAERIVVKPNFVHPDPSPKNGPGTYALYVGRLSEEKGLRTLLAAWSLRDGAIPLRIAGDGPLRDEVAAGVETKGLRSVELLGRVSPSKIPALMQSARFLLAPSECYENFPLAIAEAFACGVPVIASRLGSMAEIVGDGRNGLHFAPGDSADLAAKVEWAWAHPKEMQEMGRSARAEYEAKYTAEVNLQILMQIYRGTSVPRT